MNFRKYLAFIAVLVLCMFVSQSEAGFGKKLRHGLKKVEHKLEHIVHKAGHAIHETAGIVGEAGQVAAGVAAVGGVVG